MTQTTTLREDVNIFVELVKNIVELKETLRTLKLLRNKLGEYEGRRDRYIFSDVHKRIRDVVNAIDNFFKKYSTISSIYLSYTNLGLPFFNIEYCTTDLLKELLLERHLAMKFGEQYADVNRIIKIADNILDVSEKANTVLSKLYSIVNFNNIDPSVLDKL